MCVGVYACVCVCLCVCDVVGGQSMSHASPSHNPVYFFRLPKIELYLCRPSMPRYFKGRRHRLQGGSHTISEASIPQFFPASIYSFLLLSLCIDLSPFPFLNAPSLPFPFLARSIFAVAAVISLSLSPSLLSLCNISRPVGCSVINWWIDRQASGCKQRCCTLLFVFLVGRPERITMQTEH